MAEPLVMRLSANWRPVVSSGEGGRGQEEGRGHALEGKCVGGSGKPQGVQALPRKQRALTKTSVFCTTNLGLLPPCPSHL